MILQGVSIDGEIGDDVTINGVAVKPLIEAELDRRHPERLDPALLHERVDDEWSFVDTLRHLALATECWLLKVVQGHPAPWHPMSLPPEDGGDTEDIPCDRSARPSLDEEWWHRQFALRDLAVLEERARGATA